MKRYWTILIISVFCFTSCSVIRTVNTITGGEANPLKGSHRVDFVMIDNTMIVKVRINDSEKEYNFIFDTGAINVINSDLATEFNLQRVSKVKAKDSGNLSSESGVCVVEKLSIGSVSVKNAGIVAMNLDFVEDILGTRVDGIIGNNFLQFYTVTLSYKDSTLSFMEGSWLRENEENCFISDFKQELAFGLSPRINCSFGEVEIEGYIDCGNSGHITFPNSRVEKSGILDFPHVASFGSSSGGAFGIADSTKSYLIRVPVFSIGTFSGNDILLTTSEGTTCLIGNEFLSKFTVIIDYPSKKIGFKPIEEEIVFDTNPLEKGFSAIKTDDGSFVVINIFEDSPAFNAGLRNQDKIISVDNVDSKDISNSEFRKIMDERKSVSIVFKRNNSEFEVIITSGLLFE